MINPEVLKWTASNLFLVPLLQIGRPKLINMGFINSYLIHGESDAVYENAIHLLFKPVSKENFNNFLQEERERGAPIVNEEDYPEGLVLVTYLLPKEYESDYALIWEGKYSKTSDAYQKSIPAYIKYIKKGVPVKEVTIQYMILTRHESLRKHWEKELDVAIEEGNELWAKPTKEKETFKLSNHILINA